MNEKDLQTRAKIIQYIRQFFIEREYLEVETPNLIPAPAPEAHIDAVRTSRGFMHTSPELCMKRLLSRGYPRLFQICKCFRDGERGNIHLPEFTVLEWYRAGIDYFELMEECEEMILFVAGKLGLRTKIEFHGNRISMESPWDRIRIKDAFRDYSSISLDDALKRGCFDENMVEEIEPGISNRRPVFLYDYPSSLASLARIKAGEPEFAERFELYLGGLELANGFTELADAKEQRHRFDLEMEKRRSLGKKEYPIPERFLEDLGHMPQSAGIALGVDRFVMLLVNSPKIDNIVSFTPEEL